MDEAFLDTSAFMKLYIAEIGSAWLKTFLVGKQPVISELALIESATALRRRHLDGIYNRVQASALYSQIYQERTKYKIIPLDPERERRKIVTLSYNLPTNLRLRALDGLQLASALFSRQSGTTSALSFTFVTSDAQLLKVAQAQGFITENPEDYP